MSSHKEQKEDIFDRMMHLPLLRPLEPFYRKHKQLLMYLLFGGLSFFLNFFLFFAIDKLTDINALVNNIICWIACVLFQFFTNRTWVFDGRTTGPRAFFRQMALFFGGRLFTLGVEELILFLFITWRGLNAAGVKLAAQFIVIILNYVISKGMVFRKTADRKE